MSSSVPCAPSNSTLPPETLVAWMRTPTSASIGLICSASFMAWS
jgi:hypothetical protein